MAKNRVGVAPASAAPLAKEMWSSATSAPSGYGLWAERAVSYGGESSSLCSFFQMFPSIICRKRGSVLPFIFIEMMIALLCGFAAWSLTDSGFCTLEKCGWWYLEPGPAREKGHGIIGVLLAFLVVFRSQIAWGMYWEGRSHVGSVIANSRCLALELLASLAHASVEEDFTPQASHAADGKPIPLRRQSSSLTSASKLHSENTNAQEDTELAVLALESVRLIKLYFWTVVEHVRFHDLPSPSTHLPSPSTAFHSTSGQSSSTCASMASHELP